MPRRRKASDDEVFAALVRVMSRRGPSELTLREIAAEAGITAGAVLQRFGSKRALLLAHARHAAASGDIGVVPAPPRHSSPLSVLRGVTSIYAQLAESPRAALRNLAYLQNDLADPALRRHLLRSSRAARAHYVTLVANAVDAGDLRPDTDAHSLARSIEITLGGSFLAWTVYQEGSAAAWLRHDLDATLQPFLARRGKRRSR